MLEQSSALPAEREPAPDWGKSMMTAAVPVPAQVFVRCTSIARLEPALDGESWWLSWEGECRWAWPVLSLAPVLAVAPRSP